MVPPTREHSYTVSYIPINLSFLPLSTLWIAFTWHCSYDYTFYDYISKVLQMKTEYPGIIEKQDMGIGIGGLHTDGQTHKKMNTEKLCSLLHPQVPSTHLTPRALSQFLLNLNKCGCLLLHSQVWTCFREENTSTFFLPGPWPIEPGDLFVIDEYLWKLPLQLNYKCSKLN